MPEFVAGFRRVEAELRALAEHELAHVNLDVENAVLGALPVLLTFRGDVAKLPDFDLERFDRLRDYALALGHAHAMYRAAAAPGDGLAKPAEDATALRDVLQADAMALAKRGILDIDRVTKLRGGAGYKNAAFELVGLIGLFRERWASVEARSAVTVEELEEAGKVAQALVTTAGMREQARAAVRAAASVRKRAFTLLVRAYDEARRAVTYLRWHRGDANVIAPSLYAGRARSGSDGNEAPDGARDLFGPANPT